MTSTGPAYMFAARQPLAVIVLLAALLGGIFVTLWLLPLGVIVYALMVVLGANDQALRSQAAAPPRPRLTSPTFRAQIEAIERTAQEIGRSVAQAPGALGRLLAKVNDQARELTQEAYALGDKGQIIEAYMASVNQSAIQKQIEALDIRLRSTTGHLHP